MKFCVLILSVALLAACEQTNQNNRSSSATSAQPSTASSGSGVRVSGYARAGVSREF